jgi:hypothetical protein
MYMVLCCDIILKVSSRFPFWLSNIFILQFVIYASHAVCCDVIFFPPSYSGVAFTAVQLVMHIGLIFMSEGASFRD